MIPIRGVPKLLLVNDQSRSPLGLAAVGPRASRGGAAVFCGSVFRWGRGIALPLLPSGAVVRCHRVLTNAPKGLDLRRAGRPARHLQLLNRTQRRTQQPAT
jgi:hypothetical protein